MNIEVSLTLTAYVELCVVVHSRGTGEFSQAFRSPFIHNQTQGLILDQHLHRVEKTIIHWLHTARQNTYCRFAKSKNKLRFNICDLC